MARRSVKGDIYATKRNAAAFDKKLRAMGHPEGIVGPAPRNRHERRTLAKLSKQEKEAVR